MCIYNHIRKDRAGAKDKGKHIIYACHDFRQQRPGRRKFWMNKPRAGQQQDGYKSTHQFHYQMCCYASLLYILCIIQRKDGTPWLESIYISKWTAGMQRRGYDPSHTRRDSHFRSVSSVLMLGASIWLLRYYIIHNRCDHKHLLLSHARWWLNIRKYDKSINERRWFSFKKKKKKRNYVK